MNLQVSTIQHVPQVRPGMDLAVELRNAIQSSGLDLRNDDILAVTQKIISKAEGRVVRLSEIQPSTFSRSLARQLKKDARLVEVILRESRRIVRMRGEMLICETHHGFICANAGVDRSNVEGPDSVTLLPKDPDRSARELARQLGCGVIVTDTFGRSWRDGLVDTAIGVARVPCFVDLRGQLDTQGYALQVTLLAVVDALAAVAGLVMGKTTETPAALIRGFPWQETNTNARALVRAPERDLFL